MKFKVKYFQDCGYAAMWCFATFEALDIETARTTWPDLVRAQGFACTASVDDAEELYEVDENGNPVPPPLRKSIWTNIVIWASSL